MTNIKKLAIFIALILIIALTILVYVFSIYPETPEKVIIKNNELATATPKIVEELPKSEQPKIEERDTTTLFLGETDLIMGTSITPTALVSDSRCPIGVNCIWAGSVVVKATIKTNNKTIGKDFILGEPVTILNNIITLLVVTPQNVEGKKIKLSEYQFTFKSVKSIIEYKNATSDLITVTSPLPQSVTGKEFDVIGEARGMWFFESNSRIKVFDKNDNVLFEGHASATENSMTTKFVPFVAKVKVPNSYIGEATIILLNDNPSGLIENESSISFPINIEY